MTYLISGVVSGDATSTTFGDDTTSSISDGGFIVVNTPPSGPTSTYIISSGVTTHHTLSTGYVESVLAGGTASGTQVLNGGTEIASGTLAATATVISGNVASGGTLLLMSGSVASGDTISGTLIIAGGTADAVSATSVTLSAGLISNSVIADGGLTMFGGRVVVTSDTDEIEDAQVSGGVVSTTGANVDVYYSDIYSGASAYVASGAETDELSISGGTLFVGTNGEGYFDYAYSGGAIVVSGVGAEADEEVIETGATVTLLAGGVGYDTVYGTEHVSSGGFSDYEWVQSGGAQTISAGGSASDVTVFASSLQLILSGGSATGGTVSSGGTVVDSGTMANYTVLSGASVSVMTGGFDSGTAGSGRGTLFIDGGTGVNLSASFATVSAGLLSNSEIGTLTVLGGRVVFTSQSVEAEGAEISGGVVSTAGANVYAYYDYIYSGGTEYVQSGATSEEPYVYGGTDSVGQGGTAEYVYVYSGSLNVLGGVTTEDYIYNGGKLIVGASGSSVEDSIYSGGVLSVLSGGVESAAYLDGTEYVSSGGLADGTGVESGGTQFILSGGSGTSGTVSNGGTVIDSGTVTHDTVDAGGSVSVMSGGLLSASTLSGIGAKLVIDGGTVDGVSTEYTTLSAGLISNSYIPSYDLTMYGGRVVVTSAADDVEGAYVSGGVLSTTGAGLYEDYSYIYSGASAYVAGGAESEDQYLSGGTLFVGTSGLSYEDDATSGGTIIVSGAAASSYGAYIESGAALSVLSGGWESDYVYGSETVSSGGLAFETYVQSGGTQAISAYGSANIVSVFGSSLETILSGGSGISGTVLSGGTVIDSGTITSYTVSSGGSLSVMSGGTASGDVVRSGGVQTVTPGGHADGTVTFGRAMVASGGVTTSSIVSSGGSQTIAGGGTVSGAMVLSGGKLVVSSGGTVSSATIERGGDIFVSNGSASVISGLIVSSGGSIGISLPYDASITAFYNSTTHVLSVSEPDPVVSTLQLGAGQPDITGFGITSTTGGTLITFACFAGGTSIRTLDGAAPVETLRAGDLVATLSGPRPVRWLGTRRADPAPIAAWPVVITPGALGEGMPSRTLRVSPEHAMFVATPTGGVLVPARHLVNGTSIVQERVAAIDYFHVELDTHDVLFAEDALAESWRDTGNVGMFANAATRPDAAHGEICAPIVEYGPALEAVRAGLARRATDLGYSPSPVLFVPLARGEQTFTVPAGTAEVRLFSTHARRGDDRRRLGAAIRAMALDGRPIALDDPRLSRGWYTREGAIRWTDGEAAVILSERGSAAALRIEVIDVAA